VIYLPSDRTKYISKIVRLGNPSVFIFVKYEFWWRLIQTLMSHKIRVVLISGVFRKSDYFFHPIFKPFQKLLMKFDAIYVQDYESSEVLEHHGFTNHFCVGDTRIDRVIQNKSQSKLEDRWLDLVKGKTVIVYGSVWISDMKIVQNVINTFPDFIHIIAPHDIEQVNINQISGLIDKPSDLYSATEWRTNILIINNIGLLMSLYGLAKYVYVGGGFGDGIHNILEPAVFGVPVFFGPNHKKFNEALALKFLGASYAIQSFEEIVSEISEMEKNPNEYQKVSQILTSYFEKNRGATEKIYTYIEPILKNPL
ncbi:MAG: glycosyltransferase N-terminal domain-containing protein, partial [Saprospiraceae bacterium]